jgi:hypothetical protein
MMQRPLAQLKARKIESEQVWKMDVMWGTWSKIGRFFAGPQLRM